MQSESQASTAARNIGRRPEILRHHTPGRTGPLHVLAAGRLGGRKEGRQVDTCGQAAVDSAEHRGRDGDWFTTLYHNNHRVLLAYARRRVDTQTADEVVADTFLVAWRRREAIPEGHERPWLFGVARNTIRTAQRSAYRRDALTGKLRRSFELPPVCDTEGCSGSEVLLPALRSLRESDREILMLVAWEELSNTEIAQVMDLSPNAVAIRIHRARKRLADKMSRIPTD